MVTEELTLDERHDAEHAAFDARLTEMATAASRGLRGLDTRLKVVEARTPASDTQVQAFRAELAAVRAMCEARPASWVDRMTSRKFLIVAIPGAITVLTTIGTALGPLHPYIPTAAFTGTVILGAIYQVVEGGTDKAVRIEQAKAAAAPTVIVERPRGG